MPRHCLNLQKNGSCICLPIIPDRWLTVLAASAGTLIYAIIGRALKLAQGCSIGDDYHCTSPAQADQFTAACLGRDAALIRSFLRNTDYCHHWNSIFSVSI